MPLSALWQAAKTRLASFYNGGVRIPEGQPSANPGGFDGDGHTVNFVPALRDVATVGQGLADLSDEMIATADRFEAAVAAIEAGPVTSVNGMSGVVVLPEVPKVLPPIVTAPTQGTTASLNAGALLLAVDRLTSLYGEAQKTIRFQIASADSFAAGTIVHDTGVLTQSAVSVSVPDAQSKLTANTTYYVRAIQTDAKDVSSGWSAPVSFLFPRPPSARTMSAPASGATNVGAQNAPITLTAAAYSHPDGVAQATRRFELSTTSNFAVIITVPGTAGQASATIASPRDVLAANTLYRVRCVDTDINGLVTRGAATTFTTVAAFRPNVGDPYAGGIYAGDITRGGVPQSVIIASKSAGQAQSVWDDGVLFANNLATGGKDDWVMPDEQTLDLLMANFRAATTTFNAFKVGGSEAFPTDFVHWSSTLSGSDVVVFGFNNNAKSTLGKNANASVYTRAVRYEV